MDIRMKRALLPALVALCTAMPAQAQDDPHAACLSNAWVPGEYLVRPVPLRMDTGNSTDVPTSDSAIAQEFYRQGLNYLHGYVWIEAARSFHQALRQDPDMALAWWGLSRVYSGLDDHEAAVQAARKAQELAAGAAGAREQRRIALRLQQLEAIEDLGDKERHAAYKKAIDAALALDSSDVELWLIRGNAEEPTAAGRGQRGNAASATYYMEALKREPRNAAAHHYLVHSYETTGKVDRALEHGEIYATVAPAIPHAHHMWGHNLRRVGRIDDAIKAFTRTNELETSYYAAEKIAPQYDWHHVHNMDLLATSFEHKGQMKRAETYLRRAAAIQPLTEYQSFNQKSLTVFLLGRQRWNDALEAAGELIRSKGPAARVVGYTYQGHAHLGLGNRKAAQYSLDRALLELESVPALAGGIAVTRAALSPYIDALRAEILLYEGKVEDGSTLLEDVQSRLRALPGPDAWTQALFRLEAFARTARTVKAWDLAEHTARQMLDHDAAYGGSHLALALVAGERGNVDLARRSIAAARSYWKDADADLKELKELRLLEANLRKQVSRQAQRATRE
jgi:tetratricopeptide (TPR) repeat protein